MTVLTRVDTKGKLFTQRVTKKPLRVLLQTSSQTFVGTVHVRPENRLLDELNDPQVMFLALTNVRVYNQPADTVLYTTGFLALNKGHIVAIGPVEDLVAGGGLGVWLSSLRAALEDTTPGEVVDD